MKTSPSNSTCVKHWLLCGALALLSAPSFAAGTWALDSACGDSQSVGNTVSCGSGGGTSLSAQAYSTGTGTVALPTTGTVFAAATLRNWGSGYGLGVVATNEDATQPTHAADNQNGTDLILLSFGKAVNITSLTLGYWASDADITLMAYTGLGAPTIAGKTLTTNSSSLNAANGWSSIKNYGTANTLSATNTGGTSNDITYATSDTTTYSSWWLVSAYNSGYGGGAMDAINDFVKLLSVAANVQPTTGKVPEPGSLALMGAGLLGILGSRRRKAAAAV